MPKAPTEIDQTNQQSAEQSDFTIIPINSEELDMIEAYQLNSCEIFDKVNAQPSYLEKALAKRAILIALTAMLILPSAGCSESASASAKNTPNATPIVTTSAPSKTSPIEAIPTPKPYTPEIPTSESLEIVIKNKTPEQLAEEIVKRINGLNQIGLSHGEDLLKAYKSSGSLDLKKWITVYYEPYFNAYFTALFGKSYESKPKAAQFAKAIKDSVTGHTYTYIRSVEENLPDSETYKEIGALPLYKYELSFIGLKASRIDELEILILEADNTGDTYLKQPIYKKTSVYDKAILICSTTIAISDSNKEILLLTGSKISTT